MSMRTFGPLWLERLSMTTMSPGRRGAAHNACDRGVALLAVNFQLIGLSVESLIRRDAICGADQTLATPPQSILSGDGE